MRDYAEIAGSLREAPEDWPDKELHYRAADAIEELLAELERYRHAAFVIGETCVDESKCHISPEDAIKKIRENIYYSRQMPLPEHGDLIDRDAILHEAVLRYIDTLNSSFGSYVKFSDLVRGAPVVVPANKERSEDT